MRRAQYMLLCLTMLAGGLSLLLAAAAALLHRPFLQLAVDVWPALAISVGAALWHAWRHDLDE